MDTYRVQRRDMEKKAKIDRMHKMNLFKMQLMPAFVPGSEE